MDSDLKNYYENLQMPWSKLFYEMLKSQLNFAHDLRILDFGSGFGVLANTLACNNQVIAVEPKEEMVQSRNKDNSYEQFCGSIEILKKFEAESFDLILCHNVLEYVDERSLYFSEFHRLLKKDGSLSLVKHNRNGRIMQKVVYENNIEEAVSLLNGGVSFAKSFGKIRYYENKDITKDCQGFEICKVYGLRTFFALQQNNELKNSRIWFKSMLEIESAVSQNEDFVKIAFYNHLLLKKA